MTNDQNELNSLRSALKVSPQNIPLLKIFAQACLNHWSLVEAKEAFEKILTVQPTDLEAQLGIAQVLFQTGKTSEAMVRAQSLLQKDSQFAPTLTLLSKIYLSENNLDAAKTHYKEAQRLDPSIQDPGLEKDLNISSDKTSSLINNKEKLLHTESGWEKESSQEDNDSSPFHSSVNSEITERPKITFHHVGGMASTKEEIRMKIIYPLNNPELFKAYKKQAGGGVLLFGPPGCGKTLISRATAGEIKANFFSIGLHQILDMYIGNSEKNLHDLFDLARQQKPSVIFIDEIDALASDRKDLRQSAARTLINQFLAELDGSINSNEGVLILGATNAPWHIDSAFRRPGRFDRIIFIPPPDELARTEIIKLMSHDKPIAEIDIPLLAQKTNGFSGADLKSLFDITTENTLAKALKENRIIPIKTSDFLNTLKTIMPSTKAWFETAKNYALYSNQSGLYDPILSFLGIKK